MNEYEIIIEIDDQRRVLQVEAETAARARIKAEDETEGDVISVRFIRATGFSCRLRGSV